MFKRVLCLVLIISLCVPLFCISASASSYDVAPSLMYDLLDSMEFSYYTDDVLTSVKNTPMSWLPQGYDHKIQWKIPNYLKFNKIVIDVVSSVRPDNVKFTNLANTVSMEYLGTYGSGQLQKYQYVVTNPSLVLVEMAVIIEHESMVSGYFGVVSCVGYNDELITPQNINYFTNAIYTNPQQKLPNGQPADFLSYQSIASGTDNLPISVVANKPYTSFDTPLMKYGEVYVKFPVPNGLKTLDSLSILLDSIGSIYDVSARLEEGQGTVVATLPCEFYESGETQSIIAMYMEEVFYRTTASHVTINLNGYDLEGLFISLYFKVKPVTISNDPHNAYGYFFRIKGAGFKTQSYDLPWYNIFAKWLSDTFKPIFKTIEGYVTNIFIRLGNFWNDFLDFADDVLASLGFDSEEVEDFESDISDKSEEISGVGEKFDSISKPNISSGTVDIMGGVDASAASNVNLLVTPILSNEFVVRMILMVLTFSLVSYVLFGKR